MAHFNDTLYQFKGYSFFLNKSQVLFVCGVYRNQPKNISSGEKERGKKLKSNSGFKACPSQLFIKSCYT